MNTIQIETARLMMRPFATGDIDELHSIWTDPQVRKYLWDDEVIPREVAEEVVCGSIQNFLSHGLGFFAVMLKGSDAMIGFCGFRHFGDPPEVEILYGLLPDHWGGGLATEAARAMLRFGFEEAGLDRIYAGADPPNAASFRVMGHCAMKFEKRVMLNNLEAVYYVISRKDFQPHDSPYIVCRP